MVLENSGDQSVLKEINPEYSLEGLILELKLQYFGHLMRRANSLEKSLMLGKTHQPLPSGNLPAPCVSYVVSSPDKSSQQRGEAEDTLVFCV